jgi:hypothetical protein
MKKLILAACLIVAISPVFSQTIINNSGASNHGQGDCQCIGIGIPVNLNGDQAPTPAGSVNSNPSAQPNGGGQEKMLNVSPGLWYTYFQLYLLEMSNSLHKKGVN